MRKLLSITLTFLALILFPAAPPAAAQQVLPPLGTTALVCVYNSTAPVISSGAFAYVQCDANGKLLAAGVDPSAYIAGNWYVGKGSASFSAGTAPGANSARCNAFYFTRTVTVDFVGLRVTTLSAGGNVQAAIYANSTSNRPTGSQLAATASMSTTTATSVNSALALQFVAGTPYWLCTNIDNATAALASAAVANLAYVSTWGETTQTAIMNGGAATVGVSTPLTFGTWGDLSAATWTVIGTATSPIASFHLASVP